MWGQRGAEMPSGKVALTLTSEGATCAKATGCDRAWCPQAGECDQGLGEGSLGPTRAGVPMTLNQGATGYGLHSHRPAAFGDHGSLLQSEQPWREAPSQGCAAATSISSKSLPSSKSPFLLPTGAPAPGTPSLLSISADLPVLGVSPKWNPHSVASRVCLLSVSAMFSTAFYL